MMILSVCVPVITSFALSHDQVRSWCVVVLRVIETLLLSINVTNVFVIISQPSWIDQSPTRKGRDHNFWKEWACQRASCFGAVCDCSA